MRAVASVLYFVLLVFWLLLLFRVIMDYVFIFARSFRPAGPLAAVLEVAYSITDPPLKALRRVIPPLRLGSISLDLAFIVLFFLVTILMNTVGGYR